MGASSTVHASGVFIGTGADLEVKDEKVGFEPSKVSLRNLTDGSTAEWSSNMADGSMIKQKAGTTTNITGGNGITPLASGFRLGADGDLNAADDEIHFDAWG